MNGRQILQGELIVNWCDNAALSVKCIKLSRLQQISGIVVSHSFFFFILYCSIQAVWFAVNVCYCMALNCFGLICYQMQARNSFSVHPYNYRCIKHTNIKSITLHRTTRQIIYIIEDQTFLYAQQMSMCNYVTTFCSFWVIKPLHYGKVNYLKCTFL